MFDVPNLEDAKRFLQAISRGGELCFQTFDDLKDRRETDREKVIPKWKYGKFENLSKWLLDENQKGAGVYIVVNEGDGKGRSKDNITAVRAVFVDLDGAPLQGLRDATPLPNIVVESSPGRYHGYWLVDDCPLGRFTEVQSTLARKFNGDPSVKDLPRVMRVPGFLHKKGDAFTSKIKHCSPTPVHHLNDLLYSLGIEQEPPAPKDEAPPIEDGESLRIPKGQRHGAAAKTAGRLRNSGFTGSGLLKALMDWNVANCTPPLSYGEIEKLAQWGNAKGGYAETWYDKAPDPKKIFGNARTFKQLTETKMDPIRWVIEDVLPEGLCILAGKPKVGKSWLTQSWCLAVAKGSQAMGCFQTHKGQVLSLSLEDSDRRFASRMATMLDGEPAPDNAHFCNEWGHMPHAATLLRQWLDEHGDTQLIIIDTLGKIQSKKQSRGNAYYSEYDDIATLQSITQEYRCAIVVVHHLRKGEADDDIESVSGTIGITGAADTISILRRTDRSKPLGKLIIHGRDIPEKYYDLEFQERNGLWLYKGKTDTSITEVQMQIIEAMQDGIPRTKAEIMKKLFGPDSTNWADRKKVDRAAGVLIDKGVLGASAAGRGRYVLLSPDEDGYEFAADERDE